MKAENNGKNTVSAANDSGVTDDAQLSDKLKAAAGNINRANSSVIARQNENDEQRKKAESEARARLREEKKQRAQDEKQARRAEEQRQAEIEYAESYRRKLMREQRRALAEERQRRQEEREARAAVLREEKAREIAEALEAEKAEAQARSDRASELLNKLIEKRAAEASVEENREVEVTAPVIAEVAPVEKPAVAEPVAEVAPKEEPIIQEPAAEVATEEPSIAERFTVEIPDMVVPLTAVTLDKPDEAVAVSEAEADGKTEKPGVVVENFVISIDEMELPKPTPKTSPKKEISEAVKEAEVEADAAEISADEIDEPKKPKKISDEERAERAAREVEEFLKNEMVTVKDDKFIINIIDDVMTVEITEEDDPLIASPKEQSGFGHEFADAYTYQILEANARHSYILEELRQNASLAKEESLRLMLAEEARYNRELELLRAQREELSTGFMQQLQLLEDEIRSLKDVAYASVDRQAEPEDTEAVTEADNEAGDDNQYEPVKMNDPLVLSVKDEGALVYDNRSLARYLKNSAKIIKGFEEQISRFEAGMASGEDGQGTSSLIVEVLMILGKLLEIRCNNLTVAVKIGKNSAIKKCSNTLYDEIERYNMKVADYATLTGEQLTPISAFLPVHIENRTGTAIIPVLSYAESFVEIGVPTENKAEYYTLNIPTLTRGADGSVIATGATLTSSVQDNENSISRIAPIVPSLTADALLGDIAVTNARQYKQLQKQVARADKKISAAIEEVREHIDGAGWRREKLRLIVEECALHRERLLLYFAVLSAAVSLQNRKTVLSAKRSLVLAMNEYNRQITACSVGLDMPLTRVTSNLADEVILGEIPTVPQMACLIELLETVGDTVRVIGKKTNIHSGESITVVLGGAVEQAPEQPEQRVLTEDDYNLVNQPVYTMSPQSAVIGYNAERSPFARSEKRPARKTLSSHESLPGSIVGGAEPKNSELRGYLKKNDGKISLLRDQLLIIDNEKRMSEGGRKASLILEALATEKGIIDSMCESIDACVLASDVHSAERIAGKCRSEIKSYNGLVGEWYSLTSQQLPIADPNMPDYIMAGLEYYPLPHITASKNLKQ